MVHDNSSKYEAYNGSSWTEVNDLNTAREYSRSRNSNSGTL